MKKDSKRDTRCCIMQSTKESKGKEKQKHQQSSMTSLPSVGRMHGGYNAACLALALRLAGRKSSFVFRYRNRLLLLLFLSWISFKFKCSLHCNKQQQQQQIKNVSGLLAIKVARGCEGAQLDANLLERNYKFLFNRF